MVRAIVFAAVIFVTGVTAGSVFGAAEPVTDVNVPRTLPEYLQYAALHNAGLKAAFEEWKAALEQIPQAKALPDPTFTYGYFIEQVETRQQVGIMQMFPWFGKIEARTDAAAAAAKAVQRRYEARKLELFSQVKNAFYEYAYLANAIRIARDNVELMRHFEEVARAKYITATATHPDIVRAQIQVAELQDELITLERLTGSDRRPGQCRSQSPGGCSAALAARRAGPAGGSGSRPARRHAPGTQSRAPGGRIRRGAARQRGGPGPAQFLS